MPIDILNILRGSKKDKCHDEEPIIKIKNLNFSYRQGQKHHTLKDLNCIIHPGSRVLLVGNSGVGKTSFLRILTGQIFVGLDYEEFDVCGTSQPNDQARGITYLGDVWHRSGRTPSCSPFEMDCAARDMMSEWQKQFKERRDELVRILGINLNWRLNECSDGQRKKVHIMIKLLRPFRLCVIDEFISDLDLLARQRFFEYLSKECQERGAAVVYATHIFDQADSWATHIMFLKPNRVLGPVRELSNYVIYQDILKRTGAERAMCPMYTLVLEELERQYLQYILGEDHSDGQILSLACNDHKFGDQTGWVSGRLTRQLKKQEDEALREARRKQQAIYYPENQFDTIYGI
mmetsp:Transcript_29950/g.44285  ORF Transcript_29950/g.44285 Transcript_29950/m.44285 type:complete len:348 (+) Transcript_29950:65-1108(+)